MAAAGTTHNAIICSELFHKPFHSSAQNAPSVLSSPSSKNKLNVALGEVKCFRIERELDLLRLNTNDKWFACVKWVKGPLSNTSGASKCKQSRLVSSKWVFRVFQGLNQRSISQEDRWFLLLLYFSTLVLFFVLYFAWPPSSFRPPSSAFNLLALVFNSYALKLKFLPKTNILNYTLKSLNNFLFFTVFDCTCSSFRWRYYQGPDNITLIL